jgi:hypothetical protein
VKTTLETSGEDVVTTLETSGEDEIKVTDGYYVLEDGSGVLACDAGYSCTLSRTSGGYPSPCPPGLLHSFRV